MDLTQPSGRILKFFLEMPFCFFFFSEWEKKGRERERKRIFDGHRTSQKK